MNKKTNGAGGLDLTRIKAICFDVDGTLRKTDEQYIGRVNILLAPLRWITRRDTAALARSIVARFEDPVNILFMLADRFRIDAPLHKLVEIANPWKKRKAKPDYYQLIPGLLEALKLLAAHYPLAVISVRGREGTQNFLKVTGLEKYFPYVVSGQTAKRTKPFPDQIFWVAEQLHISPAECLIIGDTTIDIKAGKAAGAQTVGVLSGFGRQGELQARGADLILPSVSDLPAALGLT
ncbi:MAG: HAD family hydrolase [Chloroflexi bacterium]|nr:HAD family hydrolase [Chloroflexota bacterium]